jgi:cytosine/uracil/thiamine/allantoin permease
VAVASPVSFLADYLVVKRQGIDVPALFDPHGRYRYVKGVNVPAIVAVAVAVAVYYAVPASWIKVIWGLSFGAGAYLALAGLRTVSDTDTSATLRHPSSPS